MKIVHLATLDHGGAGNSAFRLHQGLTAAGLDSSMLVLQKRTTDPRIRQAPLPEGLDATLPFKAVWERWQQLAARFPERPTGLEVFSDVKAEALLENHPLIAAADVVNLHWVAGFLPVSRLKAIVGDKPLVWTLHDENPFTGGCHYAGDCRRFETSCGSCPQLGSRREADMAARQWEIKRRSYEGLAIQAVAPSRWLAGEIGRSSLLGSRPVAVIPYSLPLDTFRPLPRAAIRASLGLTEADRVVLFGAEAQTERKGASHIRRLLALMAEDARGKSLVFAFFGAPNRELIEFPGLRTVSLGYVKDPAVMAGVYSMADVYVLPAVEDNLPNTVMEATACGCPTVGFAIGGVPDMVEHQVNGFLAGKGDAAGLMAGVFWCLERGEELRNLNAALALRRYALSRQAADYAALYRELLARREPMARPVASRPAAQAEPPGPDNFADFSVARKVHWKLFAGLDQALFGQAVDPELCDLKRYQDLLVLAFIRANVPPGARILDVGGGDSRILAHLAGEYECWNVDKLEGLGSGPTGLTPKGYRLVRDYMGSFNPELPDDYFDLVFSISALEHVPDKEPADLDRVLDDLDRVLKPGGYSLHCLDVVFGIEGIWTNAIAPRMFATRPVAAPWVELAELAADPGVYVMTEASYEASWRKFTDKTYQAFGRPTSLNVLWRKPVPAAKPLQARGPEVLVRSLPPRLTIVTPSFNQARYLEACLDSVLSQNYPNLEYIVMDGGSTDGSADIIRRHEKHLAHWQSAPDAGQYWAVNEGFRRGTGEVMAWLNSDDLYHPGALRRAAAVFVACPEVRWLMGRPTVFDPEGRLILVLDPLPSWSAADYRAGRFGPPHIQQESTFWRRSLWLEAGGYVDGGFRLAGDLELWSRFFRHDRLFVADMLLGGFRSQPEAKSARQKAGYEAEARAVCEREASRKQAPGEVDPPAPQPLAMPEILARTGNFGEFGGIEPVGAAYVAAIRACASDFEAAKVVAMQRALMDAYLARCEMDDRGYQPRDYLVTAVVSTYASEAFMAECLADLTNQSLGEKLEIIVIDADSPQNERAVVERFRGVHGNIRYLRTPGRSGVYAAWNLGLRLARGRAVTPFSTNDRLLPEAYERLYAELEKHPEVALVYGDSYVTDEPHQEIGRQSPSATHPDNFVWGEFSYQELLGRSLVGPHPMWRTHVHERLGYFDEAYRSMADQEFWLRLGERFALRHVPLFTGLYWLSEDALSNHAKSDLPTREKEHIRAIYRARFAASKRPTALVSVIIPVWNQADYTRQCLLALARNTGYPHFELIIVDNGSTDGTPAFLKQVTGKVKVITNAENVGFTLACNQGAAAAAGDYLLFLNNDTIPLPGWLPALVDTLDRHPKVGAVGARLVYPDGKLQEAGAVVFADGTAANVGRGDDPSRPEYNRLVEVDYASGACLLVRASAFRAAGGFDARYAPAYYEETDLCFTLRRMGYSVVYNPAATVIHFGSTTAGLDPSAGMRRYLAVNREKFRAKWAQELARHEAPPGPGEAVISVDRRLLGRRVAGTDAVHAVAATQAVGRPDANAVIPFAGAGRTVCLISDFLPRADESSSNLRVSQIIRILTASDCRLSYLHFVDSPRDAAHAAAFPDMAVKRLPFELAAFTRQLAAEAPDVLWLTNLWTTEYLALAAELCVWVRRELPGTRIVCDTMDFHAKKFRRRHAASADPADLATAERFLELERRVYPLSQAVVTVSQAEAEDILAEIPGCPQPVVVPNIHHLAVGQSPWGRREHFVFLGNYNVNHNSDAVSYFISNIWPRIRAVKPHAEFHVLGAGVERLERIDVPGVRLVGFVADLEKALDRYRVFVCPLTYGAGLKGKLGSAAACGLPLVTTAIGAEGLGWRDGVECFIADAPARFAARAIQLYDDETVWTRCSMKAKQTIAERFSLRTASARVAEAVGPAPAEQKKPPKETAGETKASEAESYDNLAAHYRTKGQLAKAERYAALARAARGDEETAPAPRPAREPAPVETGPASGSAASYLNLAAHYRKKGQTAKAERFEALAAQAEPAGRAAAPVPAAPAMAPAPGQVKGNPGAPADAVDWGGVDALTQAAFRLYNEEHFEEVLSLARRHPGNRVLSSMATAVLLSRAQLTAAEPLLAALPEPERSLKLHTAALLPRIDAPLAVEPRVHLILLSHNRAGYLAESLKQLAATTYRNYAVFVADNASTDGAWDILQEAVKAFPAHVPVTLTRFPTNIGRPAGHNWLLTGYDHCAAEFIAIGDDDLVRVPPDWLTRMVNTARLFPRIAAVGGKAVNPGRPRVIHGGVRNLERFEPTAFRMSNDAPELDFGQYDYVDRVDHVIGCLHIYDRKVLDDAGVFDIRFSPCQLVDIEHHLRLKLAGYEIVYNGLITFEHLRAMGRKAGKERALIGNSLGNIVKLLHLYDAERVQRYLAERDAARRAWLSGC